MEIIQGIILGAVQGLTEFIPISSSGHLILVRKLFGWDDPGVVFDIILHLGTLLAVIIYFRKDWINIFQSLIKRGEKNNLLWLLIIATIPTFIAGFFLNDFINSIFRDILWVSVFLVIIGLVFLAAEKYNNIKLKKKNLSEINWKDALVIGLVQVLSLLPGISRSGMTISAGLFRSIKRTESTRFSFLMATIAISGASIYGLFDLFENSNHFINFPALLMGFITSFILGYLSIKYLMRFLKNHKLNIFAYYVITIGILLLTIQWL